MASTISKNVNQNRTFNRCEILCTLLVILSSNLYMYIMTKIPFLYCGYMKQSLHFYYQFKVQCHSNSCVKLGSYISAKISTYFPRTEQVPCQAYSLSSCFFSFITKIRPIISLCPCVCLCVTLTVVMSNNFQRETK